MEKNICFYLTYNMTYSFWFLSYKGKLEFTPAPVLSIIKAYIPPERKTTGVGYF